MFKNWILLFIVFPLMGTGLKAQEKFSFAFFTDIHLNLNPGTRAFEGFDKAIEHVKNKQVDFLLIGGDQVDVDYLKADQKELAEKLYFKYDSTLKISNLKWYHTLGNHDRYFYNSLENTNGEALFNRYFGPSFYCFEHKGWKFIVLNSVRTDGDDYVVDEEQEKWLHAVLDSTSSNQPLVVLTHVPFLSLYYPIMEGYYTGKDTFKNQKNILEMFQNHNLKLVLQGHQHLYEEIKVTNVQFITGGAVSGRWWSGDMKGTEEGYLLVEVDGQDFKWEYQDFDWQVSSKQN